MRSRFDRWAARAIPDRGNRSIWWLITVTAFFIAFLGPIAGAAIYYGALGTPLSVTVPRLTLANILGTVTGSVALAVAMRYRPGTRMRLPAALGYTLLFTLVAGAVRLGVVASFRLGPGPTGNGPVYLLIQVSVLVLLFGAVTAALYYGDGRERAIDESYAELARSQQALAHEEESVRGRVFDQLHGTVQSQLAAARIQLGVLASQTDDPEARRIALAVDEQLDEMYRTSIRSIARALSPASLEAGLMPALRELAIRLEGATDLRLTADPVVAVLDDPTRAGMHGQVRIAAYRVVEEAVSNAVRHAHAEQVDVRVTSELSGGVPVLVLEVSDDGPTTGPIVDGEGLRRMRSRIAALGGTLEIRTAQPGVTVRAALPLERRDEGRWSPFEELARER